jgi:putative tricarboxylic transport membrane protein
MGWFDMNDKKSNKIDFIDSIVIIALSLFVIYNCLVMPRYERWGLYATPGMPPFLFAFILLILGTIVFVRSIIRKGYRLHVGKNELSQFGKSDVVRRFALALGLILVYLFLLGKIHFVILSAAYLFIAILLFKGASWWVSAIVSVVTALAVWLVFDIVFLVQLP